MKTSNPNSARKNPAKPTLLGLVMFGVVVAGSVWFMHGSAPVPTSVVAALPKAKSTIDVMQPVAEAPPASSALPGGFDPNDPQVQAAMQQGMQQMIGNFYGDLFEQMGLTPDQEAKVNDLLLQRAQAIGASFQNAFQQGGFDPNAGPEQFQPLIDQASAAANKQLQATLGDDNYQQFQARDQQIRQSYQNGGFPGAGG